MAEVISRGFCVTAHQSEEGAASGDVNGGEGHGDELAKAAETAELGLTGGGATT